MTYEEIPSKQIQTELSINKATVNGVTEKPKTQVAPRIVLRNVDAKWVQNATEDTLKNINLSITESQLVAVIGPVGSGKSSIFNVILKELPITNGAVNVDGKISYSSQDPWLFSGSVRENILFGNVYNEERYKEVVRVCALQSDFDMFPYGDRTLVGEKGKALSGGQKARINLARCVYNNADIYLLDDPLSAVDANVGKQLYEQCIKQFLKNKICILITHQLQYLKSADKIMIIKDGRIEIEGDYENLQRSGLDFAKLLEEFSSFEEAEDPEQKKVKLRKDSELVESDDEETPVMEKETVSQGSIKGYVYAEYFKSGGNWFMILLLVLSFLISQCIANGGEYFLSYW